MAGYSKSVAGCQKLARYPRERAAAKCTPECRSQGQCGGSPEGEEKPVYILDRLLEIQVDVRIKASVDEATL